MSAYTALMATSETLRELLTQRIAADLSLNNLTVSLKTPREMGAEQGISLWLYRVVRNEFCLNNPPERVTAGLRRRSPLPVGLHYLVTPMLDDPGTEQHVMGKILQVFHDDPVIRGVNLKGSLEGTDVELRVTLETLSLDEITRIWDALNSEAGYELSVSYEVQVVEIDSGFELDSTIPVVELAPRYHIIVGSPAESA